MRTFTTELWLSPCNAIAWTTNRICLFSGLETDSGAVCMSPGTAEQPSWKGFQLKNGKPYCDICCCDLTSQMAANDHFKGKPHQKELKKKSLVSEDVFLTTITTAAISQSRYDGAKSPPSSSGATEATSTSSGAAKATVESPGSNNVFTAASKQASGGDENYIIVNEKGQWECTLCKAPVTGEASAIQHLQGSRHKKALLTLTGSGAAEATVVSPGSNNVFAAASKQASGGDEKYIIVNDKGQLECRICKVPVSGGESAIQHLQGSRHQKALKALDDPNEVPPELGPQGETLIMNESGAGKCFVCNVPINSRDSARQHIEGRQHINRCKKYNLAVK